MSLSIAEQLALLADLADIDARHKVASDSLEALPVEAKKADAVVVKLRSELDSVALKKATAEAARKSGEHEAADERARIRKWESRANDIRGEREHTALSSEIGGAKRHIRQLEDAMLEQMEAIEAADKDTAALTKKHATAVDVAKAAWDHVQGAIDGLRAEVAGLAVTRASVLGKLPPHVVKRYEQVAAKRQGVGVAFVTNRDLCNACNRPVPPQLSIQLQKGLVVESCPACLRLLVHHTMVKATDSTTTTTGADA
jgi:predicted  nucleic acid-binding Zn-ribbon protein